METRSKKRKRRRLISIASNVSSWPDVPASFESLNDDALGLILKFVGNKSYRSFGGLNYHCREIYINTEGMTKETFVYGYAPLSVIQDRIERASESSDIVAVSKRVGKGVVSYNRRDVLVWALQERDNYVLRGICEIAAEEERIDVLEEVWIDEYDEDDKRYVFGRVYQCAAQRGKLNVLEWVGTKCLSINKYLCAHVAARNGQIHILKWLQEEQGLELDGGLYYYAIYGGQLHVMKWLREQEVPWTDYTFRKAAYKGNFDILQWLHDQGCPWPDNIILLQLEPEVADWCRSKGYGNRLYND